MICRGGYTVRTSTGLSLHYSRGGVLSERYMSNRQSSMSLVVEHLRQLKDYKSKRSEKPEVDYFRGVLETSVFIRRIVCVTYYINCRSRQTKERLKGEGNLGSRSSSLGSGYVRRPG